MPIDGREREIIGEAANQIDPAVLAGTFRLPVTDGSGRDRKVLRQAMDHFKKAGYSIQDGRMVDASGKPLAFENHDAERRSGSSRWPTSVSLQHLACG